VLGVGLNLQSRGAVTLLSADPNDSPLIDFSYLSHPYDQRLMIKGANEMFRYLKSDIWSESPLEVISGPASSSDKDIMV
jgi:choline dehydrogenase-like flavoprotein